MQCACGSTDYIVTGSPTVLVGGLPAARVGSLTMHGTSVDVGDLMVEVGGGSVGATLGFPKEWLSTFNALGSGRASGSNSQTYGNCGIEASRALIHANGGTVTEYDALQWAVTTGNAVTSTDPAKLGGTNPDRRQRLLANYGIASHQALQTELGIEQAVADGRGVITSHDAGLLWGNPAHRGSGHAITVTGIAYDAQYGRPETVYVNDTGTGKGEHALPATDFFASLLSGVSMNVSDAPLKP